MIIINDFENIKKFDGLEMVFLKHNTTQEDFVLNKKTGNIKKIKVRKYPNPCFIGMYSYDECKNIFNSIKNDLEQGVEIEELGYGFKIKKITTN